MKIATWNVNSIKARLPLVLEWAQKHEPDLLLLQELKGESAGFPYLEFEALGYKAHVAGQKAYNGVALLSRKPVINAILSLPGDPTDCQARYVEAQLGNMMVASLYLPNGNPVDTEKFSYKLEWMRRLKERASFWLKKERPVVLGGDFNVIPEDRDVYTPESWRNDALFRSETLSAWRSLCYLGYYDAFRVLHPNEEQAFSFWDYQGGAWPRNLGLRIDHFLLSPESLSRLISCEIDKTQRAEAKASDHVPVMIELKD